MKIVGVSDLHGDLILNIPECDVLCIAGDIVPLHMQRNIRQSYSWLKKNFLKWVDELSCKHVILVGGNHDFCFDTEFWSHDDPKLPTYPGEIFKGTKVHYLHDDWEEIDGVKFYGSPICTGPAGWAFYRPDEDRLFDHIQDCDVLVTHQPPCGEVGTVLEKCWNYMNNFGSVALENRLKKGGIRYCLSGHIHSGLHSGEMIGDCMCYNVAIKDERYNVAFYPLELSI